MAEKTPKKTGRPRKELDPQLVEDLATLQCTDEEIASALHVSVDTITRRKKDDPAFAEAYQRGKDQGKRSLRRLQWQSAQKGSYVMQIWLGKQYLNQKDRQHTEIEGVDVAGLIGRLGQLMGEFIREFVPRDRWDGAREKIKELKLDDLGTGRPSQVH